MHMQHGSLQLKPPHPGGGGPSRRNHSDNSPVSTQPTIPSYHVVIPDYCRLTNYDRVGLNWTSLAHRCSSSLT